MRGVVAAGHPLTAEAGADVLRLGGNAVDAAVACVLMSFVAESPLTGPGAGGFMIVHAQGESHVLDFFVAAPGLGLDGREPAALVPIDVRFSEDAVQRFNVGPASCGAYGTTLGLTETLRRFGTASIGDLTAAPARAAREGVEVVPMQAFLFRVLEPILTSTPECRSIYAPDGRLLGEGDTIRLPELGDLLARLGAEGCSFLYNGDVAHAVSDWVLGRGGLLTPRRPRLVRGDRARARARHLPGARGDHEPAAVVGRDPDRGRPGHPRAAGAAARPVRDRRGDRVDEPRARRGLPRGTRHGGLPGAVPGEARARLGRHRGALAARQHDARVGDGRRGRVRVRDLLERLVLRRGGARHGRPREQHARGAGPEPARASTATRRARACRA